MKHKDKRDPKSWKGFKFAVPVRLSRCTIICCATTSPSTASIPITDVQIRSVPPPEMVANLRADNIDGFLGARPDEPARGL